MKSVTGHVEAGEVAVLLFDLLELIQQTLAFGFDLVDSLGELLSFRLGDSKLLLALSLLLLEIAHE
ncbi:MAG: hypothetical protein JRJ05_09890 [Deltaproteobacteria bacterium]|nr:hypothetical protein [Deltaproteobacteria bacterium]